MNWIIHLLAGAVLAAILCLSFKKLRTKHEFYSMAGWFSSANLIDFDHLLATPIYDPLRCSINFHPLHSWYVAPVYAIMILWGRTRYFAVGVFLHWGLDWTDCLRL